MTARGQTFGTVHHELFNEYMRPRIGKATKHDQRLQECHERLEADIRELEAVIEHCLSTLAVNDQLNHDDIVLKLKAKLKEAKMVEGQEANAWSAHHTAAAYYLLNVVMDDTKAAQALTIETQDMIDRKFPRALQQAMKYGGDNGPTRALRALFAFANKTLQKDKVELQATYDKIEAIYRGNAPE